ncbi:MAG: hypothetical protein LBB56_02610 [Chitinispirillales bacterium]|jgi:hypothetical protein|nr:hypothetical protein [Chitinispirillales bacterium]
MRSVKNYVSEEEYRNYLKNRQSIQNKAARSNPCKSIFDVMETTEDEFDKKTYNGESLNDMFRNLITG